MENHRSPGNLPLPPLGGNQRKAFAGLGLLLVLGLALRLYRLEFHSLWSDELTTWYEVWRPSFVEFWQRFQTTELTPPLFFLSEFLVSRFLPAEEWSLRLVSVICGTGLIGAMFLVGRRLRGPATGVITAAFATFSYRAIMFSQEARSYSLLIMLAALSTWAWLGLFDESRLRRNIITYVGISVLLAYTHYFGVLLIASQALSVLLLLPRRNFLRWFSIYAAIGFFYLPWIYFLLKHPLPNSSLHRAVPWTEIFIAQKELFGSSSLNSLLALVLAAVALAEPGQRRRNLAIFSWVFTPFFLAVTITALYRPIYGLRNYMITLAPMLAISACGCGWIFARKKWLGWFLATAFCFLGLYETIVSRAHFSKPRSDQVREAIEMSVPILRAHPDAAYLLVGLVPYQPEIYLQRFQAPKNFDGIYDWNGFLTEKWPASIQAADEMLLLYFADDPAFCERALAALKPRYEVESRSDLNHAAVVLLKLKLDPLSVDAKTLSGSSK